MEHQRVRASNVRFRPAQFHQSLSNVLKGILNRRVVKESHRDAPYKGIPPSLLFFFLFFFFLLFFPFSSLPLLLQLLTVRRFDLSSYNSFLYIRYEL